MAMTKAEKAELANLQQREREARALGFCQLQMPERLPIPDMGYVNGWDFNVHNENVAPAWTDRVTHCYGSHRKPGIRDYASQRPCRVFGSRLDALIALRIAKEQYCAAILAKIDQQIEHERMTRKTVDTNEGTA